MLTFTDWLPLATAGLTFTILGSIKLWGLTRGIVVRSDAHYSIFPGASLCSSDLLPERFIL